MLKLLAACTTAVQHLYCYWYSALTRLKLETSCQEHSIGPPASSGEVYINMSAEERAHAAIALSMSMLDVFMRYDPTRDPLDYPLSRAQT